MSNSNDSLDGYIFKYFKIFIFMFAGHCTVRFLFQQQSSYEIIFEIIGGYMIGQHQKEKIDNFIILLVA